MVDRDGSKFMRKEEGETQIFRIRLNLIKEVKSIKYESTIEYIN